MVSSFRLLTIFCGRIRLLALAMTVSLSILPAHAAGTASYTVSANLYCPGELNTQLPGVTAYLTNGNNPLGLGGYAPEVPVNPVTDNSTLTVAEDGTITVTVPIKNPVFTLQSIGGCSNAAILESPRDDREYAAMDGSDSRSGRITSITVQLKDTSGKYVFTECKEYPTLLSAEWTVPLTLAVDFTGVELPEGQEAGTPPAEVAPQPKPVLANTDALKATVSTVEKTIAAAIVSGDGTDVEPSRVWVTADALNTLKTQMGKAKAAYAAVDQASVDQADKQLKDALAAFHKSEQSGRKQTEVKPSATTLKAGTYTVACNVWFNKADTGLPLNPHLTNPTFPPYNPVLDNAQLVVDNEGRGKVTVPVTIQDKIIMVKSLEGLEFRDLETREDGSITSFAVDLGVVPTGSTVITGTCTAVIEMGDLAMSISGLEKDHTWPATFELNLSGLPCADGTTMPVVEAEMMDADAAGDALASVGGELPTETEEPEEPEEEAPEEVPEEMEEPSGGGTAVVLSVAVLAAAAAVVVILLKKNKR